MRRSIIATHYYHYAPPSIYIHHLHTQDKDTSSYYFHPISLISDFAILSIIAVVLLLSLLSLFCIFHLRRKSLASLHLRSFNNLWLIRLLLIFFVSGWAVNEILRLPFIRQRFLFPSLTSSKQDNLCKLQVVLSLGFIEPGFLVTLLYLINVSINQRNPAKKWSQSVLMVIVMSLSSILYCVFATVYSMGLLVACWQVVSTVINKTIRVRLNMLGVTVMMALLIQTLFLGAESLWMPEDIGFGGVSLGLVVSVAVCAAVGEIVLVIKPIMEALETGGKWRRRVAVGGRETTTKCSSFQLKAIVVLFLAVSWM